MNTPEALRALGLNRSELDQEEVTKAYRKKIRTYHPDKSVNLSPATRERYEMNAKEINNAKDYLDALLENPRRRARESPPRASPPRESRRRTGATPPRASSPRASPPRAAAYTAHHQPSFLTPMHKYSSAAVHRRNQQQHMERDAEHKHATEVASEMASHFPKFNLSNSNKDWAKGSLTGQLGKTVSKQPQKSPFSFLHTKKHRAAHHNMHRTMRRANRRERTRKRARK